MKKLLLLFAALIATVAASAQTPSLEEKVTNLETQVATLQQTIGHLQSQIDEVTKQNLSLKQTLHLQPTLSEYTSESGLNFRLISATGNSQKGTVTFRFSVTNTTKKDIGYSIDKVNFVDENGQTERGGKPNIYVGGKSEHSYVFYPDTPMEMDFVLTLNDEPQYAKIIDIITWGGGKEDSRFINIPIKWE